MNPRIFALWGGIAMIALSVVAFFMPGSVVGLPALMVESSYGLFLGLIPMNIVTKGVIALFGAVGVYCAMSSTVSLPRSIWYSRAVAASMAVAMVLGLFPATETLFGYAPLFGNIIWFHAAVAAVAGFYGFALTSRVPADRTGQHLTRESLAMR